MPPSGAPVAFARPVPGRRDAVFLLAGVTGLLAFMLLAGRLACSGPECPFAALDRSVLETLNALRTPGLDMAMLIVTWLGSMAILVPLACLEAWRSRIPGADRYFSVVALAGGWLFIHGLKWLVDRPRPDFFSPLIDMPADASFPSAHVAQLAILATAWLVARRPDPAWAFRLVALAIIALVGVSRLYLQVHFPSDVLAGLLLGLIWVALLHRSWPRGAR